MNNTVRINISEALINAVESMADSYRKSTDKDMKNQYINYYLNVGVHFERIKTILSLLNFTLSEKETILEIGSGMGTCCLAVKALTGAVVYGAEPANDTYSPLKICIDEFKSANPHIPYTSLLQGGESISLPDGSIDFIYSLEVMEHVKDPQKVISEIYRLLKRGGKAYIATANYDSFYEGHYKQFWNPFVSPEKNKHRYMKQGLSPQFFDEINFITKKNLVKYIKECGFSQILFDPTPPPPVMKKRQIKN